MLFSRAHRLTQALVAASLLVSSCRPPRRPGATCGCAAPLSGGRRGRRARRGSASRADGPTHRSTRPPPSRIPDSGRPSRSGSTSSTDRDEGRLSEQDLRRQVNVLDTAFAGREGGTDTGFGFTYAGVDYTDNATWFRALDPGTSVERSAKAATHTGDAGHVERVDH